jgi:hypothetical protein
MRLRNRSWASLATLLIAAYIAVVAAVELLRWASGLDLATDLAASPGGLAAGRVWELVTSGFVVTGEPVGQLAALSLAAVAVVHWLGAGIFWRVAIVAHVGSALLAYAAVGVLWLTSSHVVSSVVTDPDYGTSCVWAGAVGALVGAAVLRHHRLDVVLAVATSVAFVVQIPFAPGLAGAEHVLAFVLGGCVVIAGRRRHATVRPGVAPAAAGSA